MYSIILIYILIPLIFSHFFARLGEVFVIENGIGSFESVKMPIFLTLLITATIETLWVAKALSKKSLLVLLGLVLFGGASFILSRNSALDFLFGIGEKQHGYLLFAGLIWLSVLFSESQTQMIRIASMLQWTGGAIALIAITEALFQYNIFTGNVFDTEGSWGALRATSTLGNPNYLAGYLLMLLPIANESRKYTLLFVLFLGIVSSGSVIGIVLSGIYFLFIIGSALIGKKIYFFLPIIVIESLALIYELYHGDDKWLSFTSRFILMRETLTAHVGYIGNILFGSGPNNIITLYEGARSPIIDSYFPKNMIIDSSHNIWIDIFIKYGLLGLIGVVTWIISRWQKLGETEKSGLILGLTFLSMNVIIVSHLILIVYFLRGTEKASR